MIVGDLKSSTSRRRYYMDSREVKLTHTKPSQPLRWSELPITFCHTCFSKENQVQAHMHARINFHAYS
jgi:hypothetical protein